MLKSYYDKLKRRMTPFVYGCWCCGPKPGKDRKQYRRSKRRILKHQLKQQIRKGEE